MFCREHVVQLHREIDAIRRAGAELVVVGNGTPNFVAGFREITGFQGPIYCDPALTAYQAAGLHRGWTRVLRPSVLLRGAKTMRAGFRQGPTQGDAAQQGGVLVILPPGKLVYAHRSEAAGDNAPAAEVVRALQEATAAAGNSARM
jgi:alkyl-hydroperoxide reductase/thiol specific antioxidant family protein